ncbi:hypothetical protein VTK26DRAFT_1562 [Humicola hyalothermophila]
MMRAGQHPQANNRGMQADNYLGTSEVQISVHPASSMRASCNRLTIEELVSGLDKLPTRLGKKRQSMIIFVRRATFNSWELADMLREALTVTPTAVTSY